MTTLSAIVTDSGTRYFEPGEWLALAGSDEDLRATVLENYASVTFECEHCGQEAGPQYVSWEGHGSPWEPVPYNHCPHCLWSKHITFGTPARRPCGGMMAPRVMGGLIEHRCTGCGFRMTSPAVFTEEGFGRAVATMNPRLVKWEHAA
jgi:hypothetical protein